MKIDKLNGVEEEINFLRKFLMNNGRTLKYNLYAHFSGIRISKCEEKKLNEST